MAIEDRRISTDLCARVSCLLQEDVKFFEADWYSRCMATEKKSVEIRLFTEQDAQALWDLRMLALETDPWSFVDSPEELRAMSVEEFATRLRADHAENFIVGAFEQDSAVGMVGCLSRSAPKTSPQRLDMGCVRHARRARARNRQIPNARRHSTRQVHPRSRNASAHRRRWSTSSAKTL